MFLETSYPEHGEEAVVLVFANDPSDRRVGPASSVRAQIDIGDSRVPTAHWLGHADSVDFSVGASHELILAVQYPRFRGFSEGYHAVEYRRQVVGVLPLHYTAIADKCTATVRLFNSVMNRTYQLDVDLSASPVSVTLNGTYGQ
jgi:hypothetical protein